MMTAGWGTSSRSTGGAAVDDTLVVARYRDRAEAKASATVAAMVEPRVTWSLRAVSGVDAGVAVFWAGVEWPFGPPQRGWWPRVRRVIDAVAASGALAVACVPEVMAWATFSELEENVVTEQWLEDMNDRWFAAVCDRA